MNNNESAKRLGYQRHCCKQRDTYTQKWTNCGNLANQNYACGDPEKSVQSNANICISKSLKNNQNYKIQKFQQLCCVDNDLTTDIDYVSLTIFIIVIFPVVYLLIEKIFDVFINYDKVRTDIVRDQYTWLLI